MITQKYNLDLIPCGVPVMVHVSQYDSDSRTIEMTLYENGTAYTIPVGSTVTARGTKKDLTGFEVACTFSGSVVSFDIDAQMTVYDGDVPCEIRIVDTNSDIIGSANFILRVEPTPLDSSIVISSTLLPLVEDASQNAAIAQAAATQAVSVLSTAVKSVNSVLPDNNGNVDVVALPVGGTADQYLVKQSSTDGDADWETREVSLTQAQYNAITPDPKVTYYITDANINPTTASNVSYDNSTSGLSASTVQSAIDEVNNYGRDPSLTGWYYAMKVAGMGFILVVPCDTSKYQLSSLGGNMQYYWSGWKSISGYTGASYLGTQCIIYLTASNSTEYGSITDGATVLVNLAVNFTRR